MKHTTKSKILMFILLILQIPAYIPLLTNNTFSLSVTDPSSSQNECVDAWIIILGDRSDHKDWQYLLRNTEFVYDRLLDCGVDENDIYYLVSEIANESTSREDAILHYKSQISYAFETWAPTKVGPNGVLGVYLHNHGSSNKVMIAPEDPYTDYDLTNDLYGFSLESQCYRSIVIIQSCYAGSFIDPVSSEDRIVIASSSPSQSSYASPLPPHRSMFTEALFNSISWGNSIGDAFEHATWVIRDLGYGNKQIPWIDDNHDEIGHPVTWSGILPNGGDGYDAKNTYICGTCSPVINFYPIFLKVPLKKWFTYNPTIVNVPISVQIANQTNIDTCYVRTVPTNWFPPDPSDINATGEIDPSEDTYRHYLIYNSIDETYDGTITIDSPLKMDYNLTFVVEDVDGYRGPIVKSQIGLNADGTPPPDTTAPTVYIKNINDGDTVSEEITIEVIGNDEDSGLDILELQINGETVKTEQMPDYLPYPALMFDLDPNEYKHGEELKITGKAKDNAGASSFFEVFVEIDTRPAWHIWALSGGIAIVGIGSIIVGIYILKKKRAKLIPK